MNHRLLTLAQYGVPVALCAWRFSPIVRRMTDTGDFPGHIRFAQEMAASGQVTIPHFGYEIGVIGVHALRPGAGWPAAAFAVSMAGLLATAALLARWIGQAIPASKPALLLSAAAILPLLLLWVQPALPVGPLARDPFLIGYFPPNQLHNPTTMLSKPVALALFGFAVAAAYGSRRTTTAVIGCAALVLVSGIIKPSFLMALLPAVGMFALVNWRRADWRLAIFGLALPAGVLLAAQFLLRYRLQADDGVSIVWAPLMVIGLYAPTDAAALAARFVLSLLFPIAASALFFKAAVRDRDVRLAWGIVAVGVSYGYLFAEAGGKASAGDFLWSGQLAVFLMFAVTTMFLLRGLAGERGAGSRAGPYWRYALCGAALAWHAASGVRHLQSSWYD